MCGGERVKDTLRKVRGRSVHELVTRARQAGSAWRERVLGVPPPREADRLWFPDGVKGTRLPIPRDLDRSALQQYANERWPDAVAEIIRRADRVRAGRFDLLGYEGLEFGNPIDWCLDPVSGRRAPSRHWSRVPYLDETVVGDHKVVWELNRHQFLPTLAQAFLLTGEEEYRREIERLMARWIEANPAGFGINWASSLEVAFRSISWVWTLALLERANAVTPALRARALAPLWLHGRHLELYLSTYFSPNTHLTGEALGLLYLGTALGGRRATRWRRLGWEVLLKELDRQVRPDGVYFEQSTWYHRYTTDFYLHALLVSPDAPEDEAAAVAAKIEQLAEHLLCVTRPDGRVPFLGDDDGGRLLPLDFPPADDFGSTLALAAVVSGRSEYCFPVSRAPSALMWLLGRRGVERFERLGRQRPAYTSRGFLDGGLFVMREGWAADAGHAIIDAGPHGSLAAGHAHADALSMVLTVAGEPVFVDPGTYRYVGPERDEFRATRAHNTVEVDGVSSSRAVSAFRWEKWARIDNRQWIAGSEFDYLAAEHDGYAVLPGSPVHQRVIFTRKGDYWIVLDQVRSSQRHRASVGWHLAPGAEASPLAGEVIALRLPSTRRVGVSCATLPAVFDLRLESGWVSPAYGRRVPASVIRSDFEVDHAGSHVTLITSDGPEGCRLSGVSSHGLATGWKVDRGGRGRDTFLHNPERAACQVEGISTDAPFMWVRRDSTGDATEIAVVGGGYAEIDGGAAPVSGSDAWVWITVIHGTWKVETG
jgi:hypothetical protein